MTPLEQAAYLAHGKTASFQKKLAATTALVQEHGSHCSSVSWGKDSVVMTHLAAQVLDKPKAINARYPNPAERLADIDAVRDTFLSRPDMQKLTYLEVPTPGEWDMYERAGYAFADAESTVERSACRWWKDNFTKNMRDAALSLGCQGHFIGLCAEESRGRRMNIRVRGQQYTKQDGMSVCLPLAFWSARDIWAYHAIHDLPYLRIYDESPRGRERARSEFVFATTGADDWIHSQGVWQEWLQTYPEEFNAWLDRFPELRERMV